MNKTQALQRYGEITLVMAELREERKSIEKVLLASDPKPPVAVPPPRKKRGKIAPFGSVQSAVYQIMSKSSGPQTIADVAKGTSMNHASVRTALDSLCRMGHLFKENRHYVHPRNPTAESMEMEPVEGQVQ